MTDPPDWMALLRAHTTSFRDLLATRSSDLTAAVAACPGWDVRALADHLGGVHDWATAAVIECTAHHRPVRLPADHDDPAGWYAGLADELIAVLEHAGEDGPAWTMGPPEGVALFWRRRQVHEVRMHLWDARTALGETDAIESGLALDGLREVCDVFYPRQVRLGRCRALDASLVLVPDDLDVEPVRLGEGPEVVVHAPVEVLLRMLWHREPWSPEYGDARAADLLAPPLAP